MERLLEAEITEHLGHEPQGRRRSSNARNGHTPKTVQTDSGPVEIQVPRDREGSHEPPTASPMSSARGRHMITGSRAARTRPSVAITGSRSATNASIGRDDTSSAVVTDSRAARTRPSAVVNRLTRREDAPVGRSKPPHAPRGHISRARGPITPPRDSTSTPRWPVTTPTERLLMESPRRSEQRVDEAHGGHRVGVLHAGQRIVVVAEAEGRRE